MNEEKIAEKYAKKYGWRKVKGYKFDCSGCQDDWEYLYFPEGDLEGYLIKLEYWENDNYNGCCDDVWDVIEKIEEDEEEEFEDFKLKYLEEQEK